MGLRLQIGTRFVKIAVLALYSKTLKSAESEVLR